MDSIFRRALTALTLLSFGALGSLSCATADTSSPPGSDEGGIEGGDGSSGSSDSGDAGGCGLAGQACCTNHVCESGNFCYDDTCRVQEPGDIGKPCANNSDCKAGLCSLVGGADAGNFDGGGPPSALVCTTGCTSDSQCLAGWSCGHLVLGQGTCTCTASPEVCNGKDDDCNGVIDDKPATDNDCTATNMVPEVCTGGKCDCVKTCSGNCVDTTSDPANCGKCGTTCTPMVENCVASACQCIATVCSGACVDTTSDPKNCGGCGTPCGYACANGTCGPLELAGVASGSGWLSSDGTNVYWFTNANNSGFPSPGNIQKCAVTGCASIPTTMAMGVTAGGFVISPVAAKAFGYWTDSTNTPGVVSVVPLASGAATTFASNQNTPQGIAADATNVYWVDQPLGVAGSIMKCALGTACVTPTLVVATPATGSATMLAVDAANLYWFDSASYFIYTRPLAGGAAVKLADLSASFSTPTQMLAVGGRLYWAVGFAPQISTCAVAAPCGATPKTYFSDTEPFGLATDGTDLYWTNNIAGGKIQKCALGATCASPTLVTTADTPTFIAVDAMHTYWVGGSTITGVYEYSK